MKPNLFRHLDVPDHELDSEFVELVITETAKRRGLRCDQVRASLLAKLDVNDQQQISTQGLSHTVPMGVH